MIVSTFKPSFGLVNTFTYTILDTNLGLHSVYLVVIIMFWFILFLLGNISYPHSIYLRSISVPTYLLEVV